MYILIGTMTQDLDVLPILYVISTPQVIQAFLVSAGISLSLPQFWEFPTTDKGVALAFFKCPFPKKLTASH